MSRSYQNYAKRNPSYDSDKYAQYTYANVTRDMWADYKKRFLPYQEQYLALASGPQLLDEQLSRIGGNINQAYNVSNQSREMANQRYGINPTANQQQVYQNNQGLNKALMTAQANNATRQHAEDRYFGVMEGQGSRQFTLNQGMYQGQGG